MALFNKTINIIMPENFTPEKKVNIKIIIFIVIVLIVLSAIFINVDVNSKTSIYDITIEELQNIHGIGQEKAELILEYINVNGLDDYEELLLIDGIGVKTIEILKKYTRR